MLVVDLDEEKGVDVVEEVTRAGGEAHYLPRRRLGKPRGRGGGREQYRSVRPTRRRGMIARLLARVFFGVASASFAYFS